MRAHRLTRREFLSAAGALPVAAALPRLGHAAARPITVSHSVSTFVYGQHLVAREKQFFEEEGVSADQGFIVPGGGARVVQAVTAGQAMFALGDSNHPLKITEKGKDAVMLFATDTRCSYANIVVRKELYDAGRDERWRRSRPEARRRGQGGGRGHRHRLRHVRVRGLRPGAAEGAGRQVR